MSPQPKTDLRAGTFDFVDPPAENHNGPGEDASDQKSDHDFVHLIPPLVLFNVPWKPFNGGATEKRRDA